MKRVVTPRELVLRSIHLLIACASLAGAGACVKELIHSLSVVQIFFLQGCAGLVCTLPWIAAKGSAGLKTQVLRWHVSRDACFAASMLCMYAALRALPLADASLLQLTAPLFIPLIGWIFYGRALPARTWLGLLLGLLGLVVAWRGMNVFAVWGLLSGILLAFSIHFLRFLAASQPVNRILAYNYAFSLVVMLPFLPGSWTAPTGRDWGLVAVLGAASALFQALLVRVFARGVAYRLTPLIYTTVLFAALLEWALWSVAPPRTLVVSTLMICLAATLSLALYMRGQRPPGAHVNKE